MTNISRHIFWELNDGSIIEVHDHFSDWGQKHLDETLARWRKLHTPTLINWRIFGKKEGTKLMSNEIRRMWLEIW